MSSECSQIKEDEFEAEAVKINKFLVQS